MSRMSKAAAAAAEESEQHSKSEKKRAKRPKESEPEAQKPSAHRRSQQFSDRANTQTQHKTEMQFNDLHFRGVCASLVVTLLTHTQASSPPPPCHLVAARACAAASNFAVKCGPPLIAQVRFVIACDGQHWFSHQAAARGRGAHRHGLAPVLLWLAQLGSCTSTCCVCCVFLSSHRSFCS